MAGRIVSIGDITDSESSSRAISGPLWHLYNYRRSPAHPSTQTNLIRGMSYEQTTRHTSMVGGIWCHDAYVLQRVSPKPTGLLICCPEANTALKNAKKNTGSSSTQMPRSASRWKMHLFQPDSAGQMGFRHKSRWPRNNHPVPRTMGHLRELPEAWLRLR